MRREAFREAILEFRRRRPFRPFTVELIGGSRFIVSHPEALTIGNSMTTHNE